MTNESALPEHWQLKKLGEVCEIKNGKNQRGIVNPNGQYPIYGSAGVMGYADNYLCDEGTTIVGRKGTINKPIFVTTKFWNVDTAFGFSPFKEIIDSRLLFFFCQSFNFNKLDKSTTIPSLAKTDLQKIDLPLPPLREQQAIVSKIEALFSELEKGKEQLLAAQRQLKAYRQSLLKWAFEGRLTNDSVKEGVLPVGWKLSRLGDISDMSLGKMLDKRKNKGNYQPYLRNISVRWGQFDLSELEEMRFETHEEERYSLKRGDLIVCEGGEPGRCAIWKDEVPNMKLQKALHRVRVKEMLSEIYLFHFMKFSAVSGLLEKYFTGTTIKHLTGRELKKIEIPLPSLEEQSLIVNELESKLTVCDKIEETITQGLQRLESLRQSILKKAFEGKLVKFEELEKVF